MCNFFMKKENWCETIYIAQELPVLLQLSQKKLYEYILITTNNKDMCFRITVNPFFISYFHPFKFCQISEVMEVL